MLGGETSDIQLLRIDSSFDQLLFLFVNNLLITMDASK